MEGLSSHESISTRFERRFKAKSGARNVMPFADFMALALYDCEVGYYTAERARVGRRSDRDFYTAASFQPVFGRLVAAAAANLLGQRAATEYTFVEIGAEPRCSVLDDIDHPFASVLTLRLGDPLAIPARSVVFSNELFDAQPFHRVTRREGAWRELGVGWSPGGFDWTTMSEMSPEVATLAARLPVTAPEGYTIDLPIHAEKLAAAIVARPWQGLFVAFDYGRTWNELVTDFPRGTGRAYAAHRLSDELLRAPGQQDLTCHVCWDWLEKTLAEGGFAVEKRISQESFFVHHASSVIEDILGADVDPLSPERSQMRGLMHPGLMGQKFEVLTASRIRS